MKQSLLISLLVFILMQSCFKEDERVLPYPGEVTVISDSMQVFQSYFDLESGRVVKSHRNNAWQLGFECGREGWHIITNSGSNWFIFNTGQMQADALPDMPDKLFNLYDKHHAWPDSTAVGDWVIQTEGGNEYTYDIYLLGNYVNGIFIKLKQIRFLEVSDAFFRFSYKDPETEISDTVTIIKDSNVNFVYYSFDLHQQVNLEPDKTSYDLIFGSYYDLATQFGQTIPYHVGGVLLNVYETAVAFDSTNAFANMDAVTASFLEFTQQRDVPGYRWKDPKIDITGGGSATYEVKTHYCYMIRTAQHNYFRMRFLSYSFEGRSGLPRFEYRKSE